MRGRDKCKILKQIRSEIARQNDIDLVVSECTHKGECRGTCPRCESEVRYLEAELEKRRRLRKTVALAGVSAGVTIALSGCALVESVMDALGAQFRGQDDPPEVIDLMGDVPYEGYYELEGEVPMLDNDGQLAEDGDIADPAPAMEPGDGE